MNEKIENARGFAIETLKPSKKDLETGLGLHRDSIVFDAYGFAPTSGWDVERFEMEREAGASLSELRDMKEEMGMLAHVYDKAFREEYADAWRESGVTCIFQNAGEEGNEIHRILKRLGRFTFVADSLPDILDRCVFPEQVEKTKKAGKHCMYLSCNGVPLFGRNDTVEEELAFIKTFFQLGCRMMHLTYNRRNMLGDGCGEPADGGLSDFGRAAVREMNRTGVIVDVAHSGLRTSYDAAKCSEKPMVASHSACAALRPHCRNKTDEVIKAIADTGGYIGICCITSFLGGSGDLNAFLDHIDYAVKKVGADHVAIGTDAGYTSVAYKSPTWPKCRKEFRSLWPEDSFSDKFRQEQQVKSVSWTNWPLYTVGLVQRGYSEEDIRKIIGGNVMRVAKAALRE